MREMPKLPYVPSTCWLDDDGRHVWLRHGCKDGIDTSMLPWPTFQIVNGQFTSHSQWGYTHPAFGCDQCDVFDYPRLVKAPQKELA